ncbi:hypothetical protein [Candidatus Magnetominusculus dajiuhuensis]|uniref:hypothetical protein n=1 Tax=Candidatus Magnetominusculus dajiuhuensis TaxID=3137712 RepID=UPI003B433368
MKGKSLIKENLELAFHIWREEGTNVKKTLSRLNQEHGFRLSQPTFYDWIKRYGWRERLARLDAQELKGQEVSHSPDPLVSIAKQVEKYDRYFEGLGEAGIDNEAMSAYTNLVKTRAQLIEKQRAYKGQTIIEFMRELINWLSKNDPDGVTVIEKHFNDFSNYAREKYA